MSDAVLMNTYKVQNIVFISNIAYEPQYFMSRKLPVNLRILLAGAVYLIIFWKKKNKTKKTLTNDNMKITLSTVYILFTKLYLLCLCCAIIVCIYAYLFMFVPFKMLLTF
jgi:flagellar biosynthesis protein FlhB